MGDEVDCDPITTKVEVRKILTIDKHCLFMKVNFSDDCTEVSRLEINAFLTFFSTQCLLYNIPKFDKTPDYSALYIHPNEWEISNSIYSYNTFE